MIREIRKIGEPELQELLEQAISCIAEEIDQEYSQEGQHAKAQARELYETRLQFVRALLEQYRKARRGSWIREAVESLIRAHRETDTGIGWYKIDHNIVVLKYLVEKPLTDREICKRLEISTASLEKGNTRTIKRMAVLLFGVGGLDPDWI